MKVRKSLVKPVMISKITSSLVHQHRNIIRNIFNVVHRLYGDICVVVDDPDPGLSDPGPPVPRVRVRVRKWRSRN